MNYRPNKSTLLIRIIDDDIALGKSIKFMLECNGYLTKYYSSAKEFLDRDDNSIYGVIILDIDMPNMDGLQFQELLLQRKITLPIIFLSAKADFQNAVRAFKNGAIDFLQKPLDEIKFFSVIEGINKQRYEGRPRDLETLQLVHSLTGREREVCNLLAQALSKKDVGTRLSISEKTVEAHAQSAYKKLKIHRQSELAELWRTLFKKKQIY